MYRIPHLKQDPYSSTCSAVCAQMVLAAFGKKLTLNELISELDVKVGTGTYPSKVALFFHRLGHDVVYSYQPRDLPVKYVLDLATAASAKQYFKRNNWLDYPEMYDEGIKVINRYSSVWHIDKMIKKGYIPIVAACRNILASSLSKVKGGHAIIVKRVDSRNGRVHVIDPSPYLSARKSYSINHFEAARINQNPVVFVRKKQ